MELLPNIRDPSRKLLSAPTEKCLEYMRKKKMKVDKMLNNDINLDPLGAHHKMIEFVGKEKIVLEIGCGKGAVTRHLKKNGCKITCIELSEDYANEAKDYCENLIIGDVESLHGLNLPEDHFDVILYGDVLEHLKNPPKVIQKFSKYLKKGGYIVVSTPNIANWKIRLDLLFGKFDYQNSGILDKTHLRFYTKKTLKKMIKKSDFKIVKLDIAPSLPIPIVIQNKLPLSLRYKIANQLDGLFSMQFLLKAKKR